jgi:hypothetical protein
MSKKLTQEKLENLIAELLQEEQEKLDEFKVKIKNKLPTATRNKLKSELGLASDQDIKDVTGKSTYSAATPYWQELAGLLGDPELEDKDFKGAWAKSRKGTDAAKLAHNIYNKSDKTTVDWASIKGALNPAKSAPPPPTPPGGSTGAKLASNAGLTKSTKVSKWVTEIDRLFRIPEVPNAKALFAEFIKVIYVGKYSKTTADLQAMEGGTSAYADAFKILNGTGPNPGKKTKNQFSQALMDIDKSLGEIDPDGPRGVKKDGSGNPITTGAKTPGYLYEPGEMPATRPELATVQSSQGVQGGAIKYTLDRLFKLGTPATGMDTRLERLTDFSKNLIEGTIPSYITGASNPKAAYLASILAYDHIASFVKFFDHGSGGYLFENFCALITGGVVRGKAMSGKDFDAVRVDGSTIDGSSKYSATGTGGQAHKTLKGSDVVTYFVCQKRKDIGGPGKAGTTSDPAMIVEVEIYLIDIPITSSGKFDDSKGITMPAGQKLGTKGGVDNLATKIKITIGEGKPLYILRLAKDADMTGYRESLDEAMKTASGAGAQEKALKAAFKMMEKYFKQTYQADTLTKKFLATENTTDGTDALAAMEKADKQQVEIFNTINIGNTVGAIGSGIGRTLEESKLQSLDQLIAETMRDIKRKRKK